MNGKYLLDTNVAIPFLSADPAVVAAMKSAGQVYLSCVVLGELLYGAKYSGRVAENVKRVREFAATQPVLDCDADTAEIFSDIRTHLRTIGRPIPENDIWIASHAVQYGLSLATRDRHFHEIHELSIADW